LNVTPVGLGKLLAVLHNSMQVTGPERTRALDSDTAKTSQAPLRQNGMTGDMHIGLNRNSEQDLVALLRLPNTKASYDYVRILLNVEPPLTFDDAASLRTVISSFSIPPNRLPDAVAFVRMGIPVTEATWDVFQSIWNGQTLRDRLDRLATVLQSQLSTERAQRKATAGESTLRPSIERLLTTIRALQSQSPTLTAKDAMKELARAGDAGRVNQEVALWVKLVTGERMGRVEQPVDDGAESDVKVNLLWRRLADKLTPLPFQTAADDVIEHATAMKLISHAVVGSQQFHYDAFVLPGDGFGWNSDIHVHVVRRRNQGELHASERELDRQTPKAYHVILGLELPVLGALNVHVDHVASVVSVRLVTKDRGQLERLVATTFEEHAKTLKAEFARVGLSLGSIRFEQYDFVDARRIDPRRLLPTAWEAFA